MQKIIKIDNKVIVTLNNGNVIEREITEKLFDKVVNATTDKEVMELLCPEIGQKTEERNRVIKAIGRVKDSKLLTIKDDIVYWESVSKLSVPQEFVEKIIQAEQDNDAVKITAYKNFWTLLSLNPNEECRKNLFWFLQKYGMTIAKCGFFVAYRNVDKTLQEGVFTDNYTHSFVIKIGEMVTMDRDKCDCNSGVTCSRGLHVSGKGWLKKNYYGNVGLACLVNPCDVVAVPKEDNYGKLRTCAYLPMEVIYYNENEDVIPLKVEDGFDCSYVTKVIYEGIMGTEEDSPYKIVIPDVPILERESIQDTLLDIAMECIVNRGI